MKYIILCCSFFFIFSSASAQFKPNGKGLTIIVTDGTDDGKNSKLPPKSDIPTSYEQVGSRKGTPKEKMVFTAPIRELGMSDCIQAAAFLERPKYGKLGFMLIFSINDAIGGQQATLVKNGKTYKGVYRLIKQKTSSSEEVPEGMTTYHIEGTFFLLGIS